MSFNRENVIFQQPDGRWARGFYAVLAVGADPEWDVEYDFTRFEWLRTGLSSEQAAKASWDGANPGGYSVATLADEQFHAEALWKIALASGAQDVTPLPAAAPAAPAPAPAAGDELDGLKFAELMAIAKDLKVPGRGTARAPQLREGIRAARAAR